MPNNYAAALHIKVLATLIVNPLSNKHFWKIYIFYVYVLITVHYNHSQACICNKVHSTLKCYEIIDDHILDHIADSNVCSISSSYHQYVRHMCLQTSTVGEDVWRQHINNSSQLI